MAVRDPEVRLRCAEVNVRLSVNRGSGRQDKRETVRTRPRTSCPILCAASTTAHAPSSLQTRTISFHGMSAAGAAVIASRTTTILFFLSPTSSVYPGDSGGTSVNCVPEAVCCALNSRSFERKSAMISACVSGKVYSMRHSSGCGCSERSAR